MASFRVKLVCMNGGLSPGAEIVHYLAEDANAAETFVLYNVNEGTYSFSNHYDESHPGSFEALVKLSRKSFSTFSIVLEALVVNIYIESDIPSRRAGLYDPDRIEVPQSSRAERHYIHLRPDDIINLKDDGVKVMVMVETNTTDSAHPSSPGNIADADRQQAEVQVRSSNTGSDQDVASEDMNDEADESDNDLDHSTTDLPARALPGGELTPATARTINQTIMETPSATSFRKDTACEPYSTAQEVPTSDTVILPGRAESPTIRVQENKAIKAIMKDSPLAQDPGNLPSTPPEEDVDMSDQTPLALRTYTGERTGQASLFKTDNLFVENTSSDRFEKEVEQVEGMDQDVRSSPDPVATSEYEPKDVAYTAASASVVGSTKRKVSEVDDEEQSEEMLDPSQSSKKRKFDRGPKVMQGQQEDDYVEGAKSETVLADSDAIGRDDLSIEKSDESDADDAESEEDTKPAKPGTSGKLTKSARRTTKSNTRGSQPSKRSPEVVVPASRSVRKRKSDSTSSSMASSNLAGGTPSILLSSDSPLRKAPTANFLKSKGAAIIDDVKTRRAHFVCVLNGDRLTTTAKVLRSLALGKLVVTEEWIAESKKATELLPPEDFVHKDLKPNIEKDRSVIFSGINLFFTAALAEAYGKGFKAIKDLAKDAGANHVEVGSSASFGSFKNGRMGVICFGQQENDPDVARLQHSHKIKVYHKNLLTQSILKGELDLDGDEHVL